MNVKILVACHRPSDVVRDDVYTPVLAGAAVRTTPAKEGACAPDDDFLSRMAFTDDQGENISSLNRRINEMTVLYWAWKNYDRLGNPDAIGLSHYRRFFLFDESDGLPQEKWLRNSEIYVYRDADLFRRVIDSKPLKSLLARYPVLCSRRYAARELVEKSKLKSCRDRFVQLMYGKKGEIYDEMERLVLAARPDFKDEIDYMRTHTDHYLFNMFVMPREMFFDYCEFVFPILLKLAEFDRAETDVVLMRSGAYVSEFLTSLYLASVVRTGRRPVKEMRIACWDMEVHGFLRRLLGPLIPLRFRLGVKRLLGIH